MPRVERIWEDATCEVHRSVVGPMDNNVYVLRCRRTGDALLVDAANEHDLLLEICRDLGVRQVVETHGHWDHIQAVPAIREAGIAVAVTPEDAGMLPSYDLLLDDEAVVEVGRLRVHTIATPGHTPGSMCFAVEGTPLLLSGDTLFPGGPGNTSFPGGDFATIIRSIERRLLARF
ncbi:MAG: MBL fold metallo-hydrolase, partial [Acidimicrobiales bacterium]